MDTTLEWHRPQTQSRSIAPPAHALRTSTPYSLFFDFRLHATLTPTDILRIFSDTSLAYHEEVIGIRFIPTYRLAHITFKSQDAVDYHLAESGPSTGADVRCWPAIDPSRIIRSIWLRGTPMTEPELLEGWVRESLEHALPGEDGWRVLDIRLQYFVDTDILTDSMAVSLLLPPCSQDQVNTLLHATLPREISVGGVAGIQVTWNGALPWCVRCKSTGHAQRACHQSTSHYSDTASLSQASGMEKRRKRGRRGGRKQRFAPDFASVEPSNEFYHDEDAPSQGAPISEITSSLQLPDAISEAQDDLNSFMQLHPEIVPNGIEKDGHGMDISPSLDSTLGQTEYTSKPTTVDQMDVGCGPEQNVSDPIMTVLNRDINGVDTTTSKTTATGDTSEPSDIQLA